MSEMLFYAIVGFSVGMLASPFLGALGSRILRKKRPPPRDPLLETWWMEGGDYVIGLNDTTIYRGGAGEWYDYGTVKRSSRPVEDLLSDMEEAIKWGRHDDKKVGVQFVVENPLFAAVRKDLEAWSSLGDTPVPNPMDGSYDCEHCDMPMDIEFLDAPTKLCNHCAQEFIRENVPILVKRIIELEQRR